MESKKAKLVVKKHKAMSSAARKEHREFTRRRQELQQSVDTAA